VAVFVHDGKDLTQPAFERLVFGLSVDVSFTIPSSLCTKSWELWKWQMLLSTLGTLARGRSCAFLGRPPPPAFWTAKVQMVIVVRSYTFQMSHCSLSGSDAVTLYLKSVFLPMMFPTFDFLQGQSQSNGQEGQWQVSPGSGKAHPSKAVRLRAAMQFLLETLPRYLNQPVKVKFTGGREVKGILKGRSCTTTLQCSQ